MRSGRDPGRELSVEMENCIIIIHGRTPGLVPLLTISSVTVYGATDCLVMGQLRCDKVH